MKFEVSLKTEAPLAISRSRAKGNQLQTLRHIPGTAWRGAVAAYMIRQKNLGDAAHKDNEFESLFLQDKARFGDLRIEGSKPTPLSARFCNYHQSHRAWDVLLDSALGVSLRKECTEQVNGEHDCEAKLAHREGFYSWSKGRPELREIKMRVTAHTAIANGSLCVRPAQFYSSEVLERKQTFRGEMLVDDAVKDIVCKYFGDGKERFVTIGRGATRGQGHATLRVGVYLEEQSKAGEQSLREQLEIVNEPFASRNEVAFTCTLLSPCLVFDEWLFARSYLTAGDLAEAAGEALGGYEPRVWYSRMTTLSGWNAQANLPKSDIPAIAPGSSFLFSRSVAPVDRNRELDRLASLLMRATRGIGERWGEGLGEVVFCDKFHYRQRSS